MLKHIVLFKLADEAEGADAAANADKVCAMLNALPAEIPEIAYLEAGKQALDDPSASHVALTVHLADEAALQQYAMHPKHLEAVAFIKKVITERRVVDYFAH